jgi:hypothetical protein
MNDLIKYFIIGIILLCNCIATAIPNLYFYPEGQKPPGIPADSASSTGIALSAWADAQVDGNEALFTFGNDEMAHSEIGSGSRSPARILFNFSEAYSNISETIQSAELYLYVCGASSQNPALTLSVARVTADWDENTVTYNSEPSFGATQSGYESSPTLNSQIAIDVGNVMESERLADEADRHGLVLIDTSEASPLLFTKESPVAEYSPYVHVFIPEPGILWIMGLLSFLVAGNYRRKL